MCVHPLKTCPMCNSGCIIVASQLRECFFLFFLSCGFVTTKGHHQYLFELLSQSHHPNTDSNESTLYQRL